MVNILPVFRKVALGASVLFALITLGLAAHVLSTTLDLVGGYYNFTALAVATSVLTLVIVPTFLVIDFIRTGAVTSMVIVELGVLSVLWVMWLAVGADAVDANSRVFPVGCGFFAARIETACHEFSGIIAFGFLTWLDLLAYTITLLVVAIIGATRGHKVWTSSVKETNFLAPSAASGGQTGGYPLEPAMQQGQYPQAGTPPVQGYPQTPTGGYAGYPATTPAPQSPYPQV